MQPPVTWIECIGGPRDGERLPIYTNLTALFGGLAVVDQRRLALEYSVGHGGAYYLDHEAQRLRWKQDA